MGAGHNGLTAAAFLAQAGLSILILERRGIVGGSCVTEEIAPDCRASTTSYISSSCAGYNAAREVLSDRARSRWGVSWVRRSTGEVFSHAQEV